MREGGDQFSSAARKFSRVKSQETNSLQNKRRKVELYMEICKRKQKKQKGKLETFPTQSLFKYRYSIDLPFSFELYQKSYTLLKHSVAFGI